MQSTAVAAGSGWTNNLALESDLHDDKTATPDSKDVMKKRQTRKRDPCSCTPSNECSEEPGLKRETGCCTERVERSIDGNKTARLWNGLSICRLGWRCFRGLGSQIALPFGGAEILADLPIVRAGLCEARPAFYVRGYGSSAQTISGFVRISGAFILLSPSSAKNHDLSIMSRFVSLSFLASTCPTQGSARHD